jgi:hypothetical protein
MRTEYVERVIHLVDRITMRCQKKLASPDSLLPGDVVKQESSGAAGSSSVTLSTPSKRSRQPKSSGTEISSPFKLLLQKMDDRVRRLEFVLEQDIRKLFSHHTQQLKKSKTLSAVVKGSSVTSEQFQSLCDAIHITVESWIAVNLDQSTDGTADLRQSMRSAMKHFFVANLNGGERKA